MTTRIGVISDTHGLLRHEAVAALGGSDLILHAGDIGTPEVVAALERIAPVRAVRGNNDRDPWALKWPETDVVEAGGISIYLLHNLAELDLDPRAASCRVVVSGHSHIPKAEERDGVLYLNPGSAGPRRFKLPIAVARLRVDGSNIAHEILTLDPLS
jgi:putative phosphoesterase